MKHHHLGTILTLKPRHSKKGSAPEKQPVKKTKQLVPQEKFIIFCSFILLVALSAAIITEYGSNFKHVHLLISLFFKDKGTVIVLCENIQSHSTTCQVGNSHFKFVCPSFLPRSFSFQLE